jgi:hypothetical protein
VNKIFIIDLIKTAKKLTSKVRQKSNKWKSIFYGGEYGIRTRDLLTASQTCSLCTNSPKFNRHRIYCMILSLFLEKINTKFVFLRLLAEFCILILL